MLALSANGIGYRYSNREALRSVSFEVAEGELFGLLGPNGGGKTTLFRLLATILPLQEGDLQVFGGDVARQPHLVRRLLGVTFQSPSLDGKLSVVENLKHQGRLFGMDLTEVRRRTENVLADLGLADRASERVDTLSGGLKRRVEIAKSLLHTPRLLLLDEPTTGVDPGARHDVWRILDHLRREKGVTIVVTTHLMEEAERCTRLAILDRGRLAACGTPIELKASTGGERLTLQGPDLTVLELDLRSRGFSPQIQNDSIRISHPQARQELSRLLNEQSDQLTSAQISPASLEDVFLKVTGHSFFEADAAGLAERNASQKKRGSH